MFDNLQGDVGGPVVINTAPVTATATPAVWTIAGINSYTKGKCLFFIKFRYLGTSADIRIVF
jgi:hypothetical protein